jgi:hypothetical protein
MVTNFPQVTTAEPVAAGLPDHATGSGFVRLVLWLRQFMCGLHGHDSVLHFERNRVLLRCTSCGHDSPGWQVSERRPRPRFEGDARRHMLQQRPVFRVVRSA